METLKKILLIVLLAGFYNLNAQTNKYSTAFYKSYEFEKTANYTGAIKELVGIYSANDYFINIRLGWLFYLSKNYSESLKYYQKAIVLKPYAIEAKFGCIKPLSALEKWDKVEDQYLEILKIDPQNSIANYWLGVIYYNRKDYISSNRLFEKVVNLYPLDYDSVIMLAWTKLNLGKTNEAKVLFNHALTLRQNDKSAFDGLKLIK
jgi:tetratricopeptide (TPR) repeat protein